MLLLFFMMHHMISSALSNLFWGISVLFFQFPNYRTAQSSFLGPLQDPALPLYFCVICKIVLSQGIKKLLSRDYIKAIQNLFSYHNALVQVVGAHIFSPCYGISCFPRLHFHHFPILPDRTLPTGVVSKGETESKWLNVLNLKNGGSSIACCISPQVKAS